MTATCGGIGSANVARVLDFPAGMVGVNASWSHSCGNWEQESGDVLEFEDDRGKIRAQSAGFLFERWFGFCQPTCVLSSNAIRSSRPTSVRAALIGSRVQKSSTNETCTDIRVLCVKTLQAKTQKIQTKLSQRARLWNNKASVNDAVWEAAVQHYGNVSVSSDN